MSQALNTSYFTDVANRYDGLQDTILMDVNRMVKKYGEDSFKKYFEQKYLTVLPVDLRIIMTWNQPNVDLDLRIIEPGGE